MLTYVFNSFGYILRSGIAGSYDDSMFNLLRNHQTVFHRNWTILHSKQQCTRVPISLLFHQHLIFSFLNFTIVILVGVKCYHIVVLFASHYWPMMLNIFSCPCWTFVPPLWRNVYKPFAHFLSFYCWVIRILYIFC